MEIDPAILNRIRAESDVGSDSITHVHHRPIIPQQSTGEHDALSDTTPDTVPSTTQEREVEVIEPSQPLKRLLGRASAHLENVLRRRSNNND